MSVHLTPNVALGFTRPLTKGVKRTLTIKNNNEEPIVYKVETTAPNLYVLSHKRGRLLTGQHAEVRVSLQAMKDEPPLDAISNDKIIVKSTVIAPEKLSLHSDQIWNSLDVQTSVVHQQEIKTVYVPSPDQNVEEEGGDRAADSELPVPRPTGDAPTTSEPVASVALVAPRRRIWTYLQSLIHSRPKKRKDEKKLFSPIPPIPPIDQKTPPPSYCSVAGEHSHDDKPPPPPPSVQEHAPNSTPTAYAVAQIAQQPQPQPLALEVERELREQLAQVQEHLRTLLASVSEGDASALRRYNEALYPVSDDDTRIISDSQIEVGTVVGSAL